MVFAFKALIVLSFSLLVACSKPSTEPTGIEVISCLGTVAFRSKSVVLSVLWWHCVVQSLAGKGKIVLKYGSSPLIVGTRKAPRVSIIPESDYGGDS